MLTITGGKWTTARKMGEDCIDRAIHTIGFGPAPCRTANLRLHGANEAPSASDHMNNLYGSNAIHINRLANEDPQLAHPIVEGYPLRGAEVVWAVRHEMARTVEDVLARRSRMLFLNVNAAEAAAPVVATIMARELGKDSRWIEVQLNEFKVLATHYRIA